MFRLFGRNGYVMGVRRISQLNSSLLTDKGAEESSNASVHPPLFHVPASGSRTVGRESEILSLWQNILLGRHCQVLSGIDGLGKSTIAAEFCERIRRTQRFSCIQWFNAQRNIDAQLKQFFTSMKGRKEQDVLLVFDDVPDPEEVLSRLPDHKNLFVVMTTSKLDHSPTEKMHIVETTPLPKSAAVGLLADVEPNSTVTEIFDLLENVPLLVHIAASLLEHSGLSSVELKGILEAEKVKENNTLSISRAASLLVGVCVSEMTKIYPDARRYMTEMACFHTADISDPIIDGVVGADGADFAMRLSQMGIFSLKWEDSAFCIHPTVAKALRQGVSEEHLCSCARVLLQLWPKKWRGMGSQVAYNLVWHTYAVASHFKDSGIAFSDDMMTCMDKSASFLAHNEVRDLNIAADFWFDIFSQNEGRKVVTAESARVAKECGRLLHFLRDDRAQSVLQRAYDLSQLLYGTDSPESSLVMGFLAPYLPASESNIAALSNCVQALKSSLQSIDVVQSKEERQMTQETIFVLLTCQGQMLQEMGKTVPDSIWEELEKTHKNSTK
ncbi:hypothetical protein AGDE_06715 [Angomonas deanei]|nr:hypothetical protein AGDE_06715 [Angomonas deanei]|eukprot:EPY36842.1 hypothetical protein AGDE_06715 [Angomonas deanei]